MFVDHVRASLPSTMAHANKGPTTFGERVRVARSDLKGWTQRRLGDEVEVTSNYIARIERDEVVPSPILITRLVNALGVSRESLGQPERKSTTEDDDYPARSPLLADVTFKKAPPDVRQRVLGWPDAGESMSTADWYEIFGRALYLHRYGKLDPKDDPQAKRAKPRKR